MAFNINAEVILSGPKHLQRVRNAITSQLAGINIPVNIVLGNNAAKQLTALNSTLAASTSNLKSVATAGRTAAKTTNALAVATIAANNGQKQLAQSTTNVSKSMGKVAKDVGSARSEIEAFGKDSALAIRRFAAFTIATGAIFGFVRAVQQGVSEAIKFERELIKIVQVTGVTRQGLTGLTTAIDQLSTGLGVSANELVGVARTFAQTGQSLDQVESSLRAVARASLAPTFGSLEQTTEGVVAALNQFKISADKTEDVLGSLNAISKKFAVESEDLISVIRRAGGVFAASSSGLKKPEEALVDLLAIFTAVRATTRESADSISTGLRTIFARIQRPQTIAFLEEFDVKLLNSEKQFIGFFETFKELSSKLGDLQKTDPISFGAVVEELGGIRQLKNLLPAIINFEKAEKARKIALEGTKSISNDVAIATQNLSVQIEQLQQKFGKLIRDITASDTFQDLARFAIKAGEGFIFLADALRPALPLITAIAGIKLTSGVFNFAKGFFGGLRKGGGAGGVGGNIGGAISGGGGPGGGAAASAQQKQTQTVVASNTQAVQANTTQLTGLNAKMTVLNTATAKLGTTVQVLAARIPALIAAMSRIPTAIAAAGASSVISRPVGRRGGRRGGGSVGRKRFAGGGGVGLAETQSVGFVVNDKLNTTAGAPVNAKIIVPSKDIVKARPAATGFGAKSLASQFAILGNKPGPVLNSALGVPGGANIPISVTIQGVADQGTKDIFNDGLDASILKAVKDQAEIFATKLGVNASPINPKDTTKFLESSGAQAIKGVVFENAINALNGQPLAEFDKDAGTGGGGNTPFDFTTGIGKLASVFPAIGGISYVDARASRNRAGVKPKNVKGTTSEGNTIDNILTEAGEKALISKSAQQLAIDARPGLLKLSSEQGSVEGGSAGGGTISSLLTPQELVFGPRAAAQAGIAGLQRLNKTGDGALLGDFDLSDVSVVPGRGSGDTVPADIQAGSFVIKKKSVAQSGLLNENRFPVLAAGGGSIGRARFQSGGGVGGAGLANFAQAATTAVFSLQILSSLDFSTLAGLGQGALILAVQLASLAPLFSRAAGGTQELDAACTAAAGSVRNLAEEADQEAQAEQASRTDRRRTKAEGIFQEKDDALQTFGETENTRRANVTSSINDRKRNINAQRSQFLEDATAENEQRSAASFGFVNQKVELNKLRDVEAKATLLASSSSENPLARAGGGVGGLGSGGEVDSEAVQAANKARAARVTAENALVAAIEQEKARRVNTTARFEQLTAERVAAEREVLASVQNEKRQREQAGEAFEHLAGERAEAEQFVQETGGTTQPLGEELRSEIPSTDQTRRDRRRRAAGEQRTRAKGGDSTARAARRTRVRARLAERTTRRRSRIPRGQRGVRGLVTRGASRLFSSGASRAGGLRIPPSGLKALGSQLAKGLKPSIVGALASLAIGPISNAIAKSAGRQEIGGARGFSGPGASTKAGIAGGLSGAAQGAAAGAGIGAFGGPIGALIGGVAGAIIGGIRGTFAGIKDQIKFDSFKKLDAATKSLGTALDKLGTDFGNVEKVKGAAAAAGKLFKATLSTTDTLLGLNTGSGSLEAETGFFGKAQAIQDEINIVLGEIPAPVRAVVDPTGLIKDLGSKALFGEGTAERGRRRKKVRVTQATQLRRGEASGKALELIGDDDIKKAQEAFANLGQHIVKTFSIEELEALPDLSELNLGTIADEFSRVDKLTGATKAFGKDTLGLFNQLSKVTSIGAGKDLKSSFEKLAGGDKAKEKVLKRTLGSGDLAFREALEAGKGFDAASNAFGQTIVSGINSSLDKARVGDISKFIDTDKFDLNTLEGVQKGISALLEEGGPNAEKFANAVGLSGGELGLAIGLTERYTAAINTENAELLSAAVQADLIARTFHRLVKGIDALGQAMDELSNRVNNAVGDFSIFSDNISSNISDILSTDQTISARGRVNPFENISGRSDKQLQGGVDRIVNRVGQPDAFAGLVDTLKFTRDIPQTLKKTVDALELSVGGGSNSGSFTATEIQDEFTKQAGAAFQGLPEVVQRDIGKNIGAIFGGRQGGKAPGINQLKDILEKGGGKELEGAITEFGEKIRGGAESVTAALNQFDAAILQSANFQLEIFRSRADTEQKIVKRRQQFEERFNKFINRSVDGRAKAERQLRETLEAQVNAGGAPGALPAGGLNVLSGDDLLKNRARLEGERTTIEAARIKEQEGPSPDTKKIDDLAKQLAANTQALKGTKTALNTLGDDVTQLEAIESDLARIQEVRLDQRQQAKLFASRIGGAKNSQEQFKVLKDFLKPTEAASKAARGIDLDQSEAAAILENPEQIQTILKISDESLEELKAAATLAIGVGGEGSLEGLFKKFFGQGALGKEIGTSLFGIGGTTAQSTDEEKSLLTDAEKLKKAAETLFTSQTDQNIKLIQQQQAAFRVELELTSLELQKAGIAFAQLRDQALGQLGKTIDNLAKGPKDKDAAAAEQEVAADTRPPKKERTATKAEQKESSERKAKLSKLEKERDDLPTKARGKIKKKNAEIAALKKEEAEAVAARKTGARPVRKSLLGVLSPGGKKDKTSNADKIRELEKELENSFVKKRGGLVREKKAEIAALEKKEADAVVTAEKKKFFTVPALPAPRREAAVRPQNPAVPARDHEAEIDAITAKQDAIRARAKAAQTAAAAPSVEAEQQVLNDTGALTRGVSGHGTALAVEALKNQSTPVIAAAQAAAATAPDAGGFLETLFGGDKSPKEFVGPILPDAAAASTGALAAKDAAGPGLKKFGGRTQEEQNALLDKRRASQKKINERGRPLQRQQIAGNRQQIAGNKLSAAGSQLKSNFETAGTFVQQAQQGAGAVLSSIFGQGQKKPADPALGGGGEAGVSQAAKSALAAGRATADALQPLVAAGNNFQSNFEAVGTSFGAVINKFSPLVQQFQQAAEKIQALPSLQIALETKVGPVEVILNGASILQEIGPKVLNDVMVEVGKRLQEFTTGDPQLK